MKVDKQQLGQFVDALFRYADAGGFVSLRAFPDNKDSSKPFAIEAVEIGNDHLEHLKEVANKLASRCASAKQAIVFCPPVVTFLTAYNAKSDNVREGVALSVDCDTTPSAAREKLESVLGPATVVVASGGEWTDPETGEVQDKLHLHWRLSEPTQTSNDHQRLRLARELATSLAGGDTTNIPLAHPIRWPGSVHRKSTPRLCRVAQLIEDREIELEEALERLQEARSRGPAVEADPALIGAHSGSTGLSVGRKTSEDYAQLIRGMKTDGEKHHSVRDVVASMAAQGCKREFVEGFVIANCPVWDANVENLIDSAFVKFARQDRVEATGDPVDLWGSFDPPELPQGLLPQVIEDFALANGAHMGADPAGLAVAALVTCAAAIPDEVQIKVKRHGDWKESARVWAALIGPPSAKKSPIISAATGPLCSLDVKMMQDWQQNVAKYESLPPEDKKGKQRPPQTRLRIEDVTVEAAQQVLEGSPWGVLLLQDELSGFFGAMDKYNGGKGAQADRAFWLKSFNGGQFALNRVSRGATIIENLSVCMLGGIQPEPLRKIAGDAVDDGLLQRLFPVMLRTASLGEDEPMPPINESYEKLIRNLRTLSTPGFCGTGALEFDDGAQAIRRELEARHLELQSLETINRKLASHIGKYDGLFARLCLLWHCIEHVEKTMLCDTPDLQAFALPLTVTEKTAQRVGGFLHKFLLAHSMAFYSGILGLSDDHDRLTAIAGYILTQKLDHITNRHVQRGDRTMRGLKEHEIRPLFEQLEALGWLNRVDPPRPSSPPHWKVNPAVHAKFADRAVREAERRGRAREAISNLRRPAA